MGEKGKHSEKTLHALLVRQHKVSTTSDQRLKKTMLRKNSIKATILDITKGGLDKRIARWVNSIYTTNIIYC